MRYDMQPGDVFMMAVKLNKVDALRPLLEPFDWKNIPAISQNDLDRAFVICCQNNYVELARLLLPGADISSKYFIGLAWALQKNYMEIVDLIATKITPAQMANVDYCMKCSHNADKWQQYRLHQTLSQTVCEWSTDNNSRKM